MAQAGAEPGARSPRSLLCLRLLWGLASLSIPLMLVQALHLRRRIPRLPEAQGPAQGRAGSGESSTRLLIVGESTAVGVGASRLSEAIPGYVSRDLAQRRGEVVHWTLVGKNGASLGRLRELLAHKASVIEGHSLALVLAGVNDVFGLRSLRRWRRDVRGTVEQLRSAGCTRVLFSALPPIERFSALKAPLRWVLGLRARLLDAYLWRELRDLDDCSYAAVEFPLGSGFLALDGVHPSSAGYEEWSRQLAEAF